MGRIKILMGMMTVLFVITGTISGIAHAESLHVKHSQGETVINVPPKKVAVLDIASLDTLAALGVDVAGVPTTPLPSYLAGYASSKYKKVGSLFEPDYEALNALAPDLIIVGGRSSDKYTNVVRVAPAIDLTPDLRNRVRSDIEHTQLLGEIFHKEKEASKRITKLNQSIALLKEKAKGSGTGLLLMTSGGRISALGPDSWFSTIYNDFGIKPATKDIQSGPHGQVISYEYLLQTNPDWLFVIDRDSAIGQTGATAKQLLDNEVVHQTRAWKEKHIVYLDPVDWYIVGDGIVALQSMVDELSEALSSDTAGR